MKILHNWKEFYKEEREKLNSEIKRESIIHWKKTKADKNINEVIKKRGIVSFPHTFIKDNYKNYLNIVKSLYLNGMKQIIFVGVLHTRKKSEEKDEFSLDNIKFLLRLYAKENKLAPIKIKEFFPAPPPKKEDYDKIPNYLRKMKLIAKEIKKLMNNDTIILITGDLSHYGYGYKSKEVISNYQNFLKAEINKALKLCYLEKNYIKLIEQARLIGFDQTSVSIITSEILGKNPMLKLISKKFSDYSKLLNTQKPTVVASITYGLKKRENENKYK